MIKTQSYSLDNNLMTNDVLSAYINKFWSEVYNNLHTPNTQIHLMLMCKVKFINPDLGYRSLAHLRKVNFNDKDLFRNYLIERLGYLTESYTVHPISKIVFSYIVKDGIADDSRSLLQQPKYDVSVHSFNNMVLPLTMDPNKYGDIIAKEVINNGSISRYVVKNKNTMFILDVDEVNKINRVTINGAADLSWVDTVISENTFKREIVKSTLYIKDSVVVVKSKEINAKAFKNLKKDRKMSSINCFMTMDIETIKIDSKLYPYLICAYNGNDFITCYANDSLDQDSLFSSFITKLLDNIKSGTTFYVYAHNLSGFDGILLMKHLLNYTGAKVEPLMFNGKLISFKFKFNGKTIIFKDSYLLLPMPLRKLCVAFNVNMGKGFFPYLLNDIFYKGILPKFELWSGISIFDYNQLLNKYVGSEWSFRDEAIKYCQLDCKVLYEILQKFNELIFNEFSINIDKSLTLPALAMRIYKSQFMPKNTIYQLLGNVERDIRQSYTGGAVDAYIPHNRVTDSGLFEKLYYYDVNSLYPFVMSSIKMPVGKPIAFEGNIRSIEPNAFGFFYCKITSPDYLEHPILQRRITTQDGVRTIAGLGGWVAWICSAEMDNALRFGYQFEILKGYQFDQANIFEGYVQKMYSLRMEYPRSHPMNLIAKLLMNSLYGKFGMKPESSIVEIYSTSTPEDTIQFNNALDTYGESLQDYLNVDDYYIIVRDNLSNYKYDEKEDLYHGLDVNIAIASNITAHSRIYMSQFKNNPDYRLYYSDTDSLVVNKQLPPHVVGDQLGAYKLECTIDRGIFLAPKVYGIVTDTGEEIIKVKGLNKDALQSVHIHDLFNLLIKDSSKDFIQSKWYKQLFNGKISVQEVAYKLKVTNNKRLPIYVNNLFSGTKPYKYSEIEK